MKRERLSHGELVVIVLIVGVLGTFVLLALSMGRNLMRQTACAENLRELSKILYLYADENKDRFPPIDDTKNNFMFDANLLYPEYLTDHMAAMCPADPRSNPKTTFRLKADHSTDGTPKGEVHADCITDDSYIYLGWLVLIDQFNSRMLMSDKEVEAFFKAYDKLSPDDYDSNLIVPEGRGILDGDTIYRLSCYFDIFLMGDINAIGSMESGARIVPVMWDRPYMDATKFSHQPGGGNVLYMDGHADFIKFGEKFPMTETMARLLDERPREAIAHCE